MLLLSLLLQIHTKWPKFVSFLLKNYFVFTFRHSNYLQAKKKLNSFTSKLTIEKYFSILEIHVWEKFCSHRLNFSAKDDRCGFCLVFPKKLLVFEYESVVFEKNQHHKPMGPQRITQLTSFKDAKDFSSCISES